VTIFWVKSTTVLSELDHIFLPVRNQVVLNFGKFEATKKGTGRTTNFLLPHPCSATLVDGRFSTSMVLTMCYNWIVNCDLGSVPLSVGTGLSLLLFARAYYLVCQGTYVLNSVLNLERVNLC
jgi:hypothetical protein